MLRTPTGLHALGCTNTLLAEILKSWLGTQCRSLTCRLLIAEVLQAEAKVQVRCDDMSTFRNSRERRLGLQLCCLTRHHAHPGVLLLLVRCPRHVRCVLLGRPAEGLRECLPVLLLLPLALGQGVLLGLIHRAAALLRLIGPRPV